MQDNDVMLRLIDAMRTMVVVGDDGVARINPEIDALQTELDAALATPESQPELALLADEIRMIRETASDPRIAAAMAEGIEAASLPNPPIFDAIDEGDVDRVRETLAGVDVNARYGEYDATALYHAITSVDGASLEIMTLLLDAGADPRRGLGDMGVLHGLGFGRLDDISTEDLAAFIRRCVDLGADLEQRTDNLQWTPLITAASEWNEIATEALLLAGADIAAKAGDVDGVCYAGESCLAFAKGHEPTMAVLKRYLTKH